MRNQIRQGMAHKYGLSENDVQYWVAGPGKQPHSLSSGSAASYETISPPSANDAYSRPDSSSHLRNTIQSNHELESYYRTSQPGSVQNDGSNYSNLPRYPIKPVAIRAEQPTRTQPEGYQISAGNYQHYRHANLYGFPTPRTSPEEGEIPCQRSGNVGQAGQRVPIQDHYLPTTIQNLPRTSGDIPQNPVQYGPSTSRSGPPNTGGSYPPANYGHYIQHQPVNAGAVPYYPIPASQTARMDETTKTQHREINSLPYHRTKVPRIKNSGPPSQATQQGSSNLPHPHSNGPLSQATQQLYNYYYPAGNAQYPGAGGLPTYMATSPHEDLLPNISHSYKDFEHLLARIRRQGCTDDPNDEQISTLKVTKDMYMPNNDTLALGYHAYIVRLTYALQLHRDLGVRLHFTD